MKHRIVIMLSMACCLLLAACAHEPEDTPAGALYRHYAGRQELKVAQVCGLKLCDTVRVDVVMLQAGSDDDWRAMMDEFAIADSVGVSSWLGDTLQPAERVAWTGEPVLRVVASPQLKTIGLYRLESEVQYDALIDYQLNNM